MNTYTRRLLRSALRGSGPGCLRAFALASPRARDQAKQPVPRPGRLVEHPHSENDALRTRAADGAVAPTWGVKARAATPMISCPATVAYITEFNSGVVTVIDTSSNTIVTTVDVGFSPFGLAVTPDGTRVYVANSGDNTVSVIDTSDNTVVATVPVGTAPVGVGVKPDGSRAYVTNRDNNSVSIIDTSNNTVVGTVIVPSPYGVAVNPDGSRGMWRTTTAVLTLQLSIPPAIR